MTWIAKLSSFLTTFNLKAERMLNHTVYEYNDLGYLILHNSNKSNNKHNYLNCDSVESRNPFSKQSSNHEICNLLDIIIVTTATHTNHELFLPTLNIRIVILSFPSVRHN